MANISNKFMRFWYSMYVSFDSNSKWFDFPRLFGDCTRPWSTTDASGAVCY